MNSRGEQLDSSVSKRVSLITTVFNEADGIVPFLRSIVEMTCIPGELIIVDGGSTDGTQILLESFRRDHAGDLKMKIVVDPSCSRKVTPGAIGRGRNVAIRHAAHEIICCTDAGCRLDRNWLERIIAPFNDPNVSVVGGWYRGEGDSAFQRAVQLFWLVPPENVTPDNFIPSSRSIAFRKRAWQSVNGYPENSISGEDTLFVLRLRKRDLKISYVPDALVYWRVKSNLASFVKLVYLYGFGDGFNEILSSNAYRNVIKLLLAAVLLGLGAGVSKLYLLALIAYWIWLPFNGHPAKLMQLKTYRLLPLVVFLKVISDAFYVVGYVSGRITSHHPTFEQID